MTGIVVAILAGVFSVGVLAALAAIGTLFSFVIVCLGVPILRRQEPQIERPFRTPASPWVPLLGAAICLYLMGGLPVSTWIGFAGWLAVGGIIYVVYGARAAERSRSRHSSSLMLKADHLPQPES